jgi:WD40 repeat protein
MAYSHDGKQIAVACNDGGVRIYDTAKNRLMKTITVHRNAVSDLAFSPDGTKLATASLDNTFHVSPLHFDELYEVAKRLQTATSDKKP